MLEWNLNLVLSGFEDLGPSAPRVITENHLGSQEGWGPRSSNPLETTQHHICRGGFGVLGAGDAGDAGDGGRACSPSLLPARVASHNCHIVTNPWFWCLCVCVSGRSAGDGFLEGWGWCARWRVCVCVFVLYVLSFFGVLIPRISDSVLVVTQYTKKPNSFS